MNKTSQLIKLASQLEIKYALTPVVNVEIPKNYFDTLARWHSVGRTIDGAIYMIKELSKHVDDSDNEIKSLLNEGFYTTQELQDVKQALDACHVAIKNKSMKNE